MAWNRQRTRSLWTMAFAISASLCWAALTTARAADADARSAEHLRQILKGGLQENADLDRIAQQAAAAREAGAHQPSLDYAYGLVLQSRRRHDQAAQQFDAALQSDRAHVPARTALLRLRLLDNSADELCDQLVMLAEALADDRVDWTAQQQRELAAWLGRIHGFLALPDVEVVDAPVLRHHIEIVTKRLPDELHPAYDAGRQAFEDEYQARLADISADKDEVKAKAESELKELNEQEQDLNKRAETVQLTRAQWRSWLEEQLNASDKELETLQKDYAALEVADRKVAALRVQTQLELQRLQTEYSLRGGLSPLEIVMQPAVARLQQEILRYDRERASLRQQGAQAGTRARDVLAARVAATARYRQATGDLKKTDAALNRWQKTLEKSALKAEGKATSPQRFDRLKKRLALPATYFDIDLEAEADDLLKQFGTSLGDDM